MAAAPDRARAFGLVVAAYVAAGAAAVATAYAVPWQHPVAVAFVADLAATVIVFGASFTWRNSSFYDPYWSVAPIAIAAYWATRPEAEGAPGLRQALVLLGVVAWGVRLTANWARGWQGLDHEDWRYVDLRRQTGRAWWVVSFTGIHLMPTLVVFAGCLSLWPALAVGTPPRGALDALAALVLGGAVALEHVADEQLRRFRRSRPPADAVLATGLWSRSRHPNYLGEMGFWWGLWLFGVAADPAWAWTVVGPLTITLMFRFASLPMIEGRMLERRPAYAEVQRRVPQVIPWPRALRRAPAGASSTPKGPS